MKKVLICGPLPPPIGGVSVHLSRLCGLLSANGFLVSICDESSVEKKEIFNLRSLFLLRYLRLVLSCDIIHIHSSVSLFRIIHIVSSFLCRKRIIVTVHSWRSGRVSSFFWSVLLNLVADKVVLVTDGIANKLSIKNSKREIQPAFIPPLSSSSEIPERIIDFVNKARLDGKDIIVSNAFRLARHNGQDLYGLDLCIEAFSNMEVRSQASLIFVISDPQFNHVEVEEALTKVYVKGLGSSVLIYCGSLDYFALLQHADASIRATNTDGDAISVRESIYLGVPCIASDCINRPSEAIQFKSRSAPSLVKSILKVISTERQQTRPDACDYFEFYKQIYLAIK